MWYEGLTLALFITGMFSAAASLGVSLLWDTDVGLSQIDKYAYATEDHIKVDLLPHSRYLPLEP